MQSNPPKNSILVLGASGATGRLLVKQLLERGEQVIAVLRPQSILPSELKDQPSLSVKRVSLLELSEEEICELVSPCKAVASCLGHNLTFKGIYGSPRRLVRDSVQKICEAIVGNASSETTKFVLMNTAGNQNRDLKEKVSFAHKCVILLLRALLPPHVDNEKASDFLRLEMGPANPCVTWSVVRPDGLIDRNEVSNYEEFESPTRDAIFNAGTTSRINVAHFMADLIIDPKKWEKWKGRMPVIYNQTGDQ